MIEDGCTEGRNAANIMEAYRFWLSASDAQRSEAKKRARLFRILQRASMFYQYGVMISTLTVWTRGGELPPIAVFFLGAIAAIFVILIILVKFRNKD